MIGRPIKKVQTRARTWREGLGLSESEAAIVIRWDMSTPGAATRFREIERGKRQPSGPMLQAMWMSEGIVEALVLLRTGRPDDAKRVLAAAITPALMREVYRRAPGVQAVGPKKETAPG